MNNILTPEIIEAVGWTIVHSLWQSIAVALILLLLLVSLRQRSAQIKYFISFVSLIAVLIGSAVTFYKAYQHATEKKEIAEKMVSTPGYISGILQSKLTGEAPDGNTLDIRYVKIRVFMQRHFDTIVVAWILGIFLLMVRFMGGIVYTRRLRTRQTVNLSDEWLLKITELSSKFGIHQRIEAFCSSLARVPMTLGYMKPVIIIPLSAITGLAPKEIEAIIAHELAHVARNDYFFNLIQSLIEIVFFYNPTVWLISSKIRTEREHCCDMLAIEATNDRLAYVKTLANIQLQQSPYAQNFSMAITGHKNSMLQRIKHLQKQEVMKTNWIEKMMIAGIIMITLTLVSFTVNNKINNLSKHKEASRDSINITKVEADSIKAAFEQKITNMKSNAKSWKK
jgi:beta-lactamase regulating signal transducer with metallopeptidase domain